jgi:hypothetical protein
MQRAKALSQKMLQSIRMNEEGERASKDAAMEQTARAKQQLRDNVFAKAAAHGDVISISSTCMRNIEDGVCQTQNSQALLKQNRALAFAALQVTLRRIQLRSRRPKSELVKDYVSIALEHEQKLLEAAREEFLQLEEEGRMVEDDLGHMRVRLSADTGSRRLCMKKDAQTLRPHLAPPPEQQRPAPEVNEGESRNTLEDTFALLDRSNKHREKTFAAVDRIKADSKAAVTRTEECLEKRTDELTAVGAELKQHMNDAEAAISTGERSLDRSTKRLDPEDWTKKDKLMRDRALLKQLQNHKGVLHEQIQNKFIALEIDNMCRRVTATKACEPGLLDENAQAKGQQTPSGGKLRNSASAPTLLSAAGSSNVKGDKLPNLAGRPGTMDSYSSDKFASASPKFSSKSSLSSTASTTFGVKGKR